MLKKIMIASLAVSALALNAPLAHADDPTYGCNFRAVQQDDSTGQNFEGVAFGYVVHPGDATARIRCYIEVNGSEVSATPETGFSTPTPSGASATAGRLTYAALDTDVVTFHAEVCTNHGCFVHDYETVRQQIPPQEVIDQINGVLDIVFQAIADATEDLDPIVCGVLKTAGVPAIVNALTPITGISMDDATHGNDDCDLWDETTSPRSRIIDFKEYDDV